MMHTVIVLFIITICSIQALQTSNRGVFDDNFNYATNATDEIIEDIDEFIGCADNQCTYGDKCYGYGSIINMPPNQQMICCGNFWKRYCMPYDPCNHC